MSDSQIPPMMSIIVPPIAQKDMDGPWHVLASQQIKTMERQRALIDEQNRELNALHRIIVALIHQAPEHELQIHDSTLAAADFEVSIRTMHDGTQDVSRITAS